MRPSIALLGLCLLLPTASAVTADLDAVEALDPTQNPCRPTCFLLLGDPPPCDPFCAARLLADPAPGSEAHADAAASPTGAESFSCSEADECRTVGGPGGVFLEGGPSALGATVCNVDLLFNEGDLPLGCRNEDLGGWGGTAFPSSAPGGWDDGRLVEVSAKWTGPVPCTEAAVCGFALTLCNDRNGDRGCNAVEAMGEVEQQQTALSNRDADGDPTTASVSACFLEDVQGTFHAEQFIALISAWAGPSGVGASAGTYQIAYRDGDACTPGGTPAPTACSRSVGPGETATCTLRCTGSQGAVVVEAFSNSIGNEDHAVTTTAAGSCVSGGSVSATATGVQVQAANAAATTSPGTITCTVTAGASGFGGSGGCTAVLPVGPALSGAGAEEDCPADPSKCDVAVRPPDCDPICLLLR